MENKLYELSFHESTQLTANPYWLWIRVYLPNPEFEQYIHDVCESKSVSIYQSYDPVKAKLFLPSTFIIIDRLDQIMKMFNRYYNPNNVIAYNITTDIQLSFMTKKARTRFRKQFAKQLEYFLKKEERLYLKIIEQPHSK